MVELGQFVQDKPNICLCKCLIASQSDFDHMKA